MPTLLRTLIIDQQPSDMEVLVVNAIKGAGFGVRLDYAFDEESIDNKCKEQDPSLILYNTSNQKVSLKYISDLLQKQQLRTPILAVSNDLNGSASQWMQKGATDLVDLNDLIHLQLVIRRTIRAHVDHIDLQASRKALKARDELHLTLLNSSADPIAYIHEGMHIYANRAYLELFGYSSMDDLEGMPLMDLVPDSEKQHLKVLLTGYQDSYEYTESARVDLALPSGDTLVRLDLSPAELEGESCMQMVVHLLSETQSLTGHFDYLSLYDVSSGLYTQQHLLTQLEVFIESPNPHNAKYALILLAIDDFDKIKEQWNEDDTSLLFAEIAAQLKALTSLDDILSRYENDAYALLIERDEDVSIENNTQKIINAINGKTLEVNKQQIVCKLTAGVCRIYQDTSNVIDVVAQSQEALSLAQEHQLSMLMHEHESDFLDRKVLDEQWANKLRSALKENRLKLIFQPIISLAEEDASASYDILLRMEDKDGSFITPSEFLESAERTGLSTGLDRWVVLNALKIIEQEHSNDPSIRFTIKLTEDSVCNDEFILWIRQQLQIQKINPRKVIFEMKSHVLINHMIEAQKMISTLSPLGSSFCLDNFNGAIDLSLVVDHLDVEYLKLDAECLDLIEDFDENMKMLMATVDMCQAMDKEIIIKNVETSEQFDALETINVDFLQGNFLYPPSPTLDVSSNSIEDLTLFNPSLTLVSSN